MKNRIILCFVFTVISTFAAAYVTYAADITTGNQIEKKALWLESSLYGNDNEAAALRRVTITRVGEGHKIHISNQFGFTCDLIFDENGNPTRLAGCKSETEPLWRVEDKEVVLRCGIYGKEEVCNGTYTLCSGSDYCQPARLAIARKIRK